MCSVIQNIFGFFLNSAKSQILVIKFKQEIHVVLVHHQLMTEHRLSLDVTNNFV